MDNSTAKGEQALFPRNGLEEENRLLHVEIERLKKILAAHGLPDDTALIHSPTPPVLLQPPEARQERAKQRIALFRSLFCGRSDVYARRWTSADGRSGYSPAALMDWTAIRSSNPEDRKKVARQTRTEVHDERNPGTALAIEFRGQLRPDQEGAATRMAEHDDEILCAPTAFGKTAVAAWLIAQRKVNTLILVHRRQLLDQWQARLAMFLDLPPESIGSIGGGKVKGTGIVDVAVIQSLRQNKVVQDIVAEYGQVIVDECHHLSAFTFEQVMRAVKAKFIVGLTATPTRKDGHHPIIQMQCGPIRFGMNAKAMTDISPLQHVVTPRLTAFQMQCGTADASIQDIYRAITQDEARNDLIAFDVRSSLREGRTPLLLTGRTDHLLHLADMLDGAVEHIFVLKGGMGKKQRRVIDEAMKAVPDGTPRLILATGNYIGEGFDDARLDTLFLAMPISWKGTLQQYVGRLHHRADAS